MYVSYNHYSTIFYKKQTNVYIKLLNFVEICDIMKTWR